MSDSFKVSPINQVKRVPKRAKYDHQSVFKVIDAAWIGHIGILDEHSDGVAVIPMLHARIDDTLIFHGANSSRLMKYLSSGQSICVTFSLVDGLVLAKSLFHHSMNYRSAVVLGTGRLLDDPTEISAALNAISDKVMPGRRDDARQPNAKELAATAVVSVKIDRASAKIRDGDPADDPEDLSLPVWSGIVPIKSNFGKPICDQHSKTLPVPEYVKSFCQETIR
jgi:nitroimidazol reductase NimA-like FMN-containing flavoprotein (pyridoxamine 5'-phosphate oxidase superfamily)